MGECEANVKVTVKVLESTASAVHLALIPKIYPSFTNSQILLTAFLGLNLW